MANEYLKRTPTSTGNRKVFTFALWLKRNIVAGDTGADAIFNAANTAANSHGTDIRFRKDNTSSTGWNFYDYNANAFTWTKYGAIERRDSGNWFHAMFVFDSTKPRGDDRVEVYINGVLDTTIQGGYDTNPSQNYETYVNSITEHYLGVDQFGGSLTTSYSKSQFADVFLVDGQALTPDVFGFYKEGKGYVSAGSTQSTDFRPGQWVPKAPRTIKTEINRRGGFGVNGFYLPMNDSSNFGADFHTTPNSIITLKGEDLPQPRNGAPTTTDAYVSQLRSDPYAANLVLAVPGISTSTSANLVTNGTFDSNVSGWTAGHANASITWDSGRMKVANTGGGVSWPYAYQAITTVIGQRYTISFLWDRSNSTDGRVNVRNDTTNTVSGSILYADLGTGSDDVISNFSFTATATTTYIFFYTKTVTDTVYSHYDNIVVKQEDAPLDYSADIKGSGTNKTLTAYGNAGVGYEIPSYYGSAMTFDASGDATRAESNADFNLGDGDYTIEGWFYRDITDTNVGSHCLWAIGGVNSEGTLTLFYEQGGHLMLRGRSPGDGAYTNIIYVSPHNHPVQQWAHICTERHNGVTTVYLNGVAIETDISDSTTVSQGYFAIGAFDTSGSYSFDGYIQDVRVYKGVAKYKGGFDVPKPYTPVGIGTWRAVPDTTANNFATWNAVQPAGSNATLTNGNLTQSGNQTSGYYQTSTIGISTGKWYWENRPTTVSNTYFGCGVNFADGNSGNTDNDYYILRMTGDLFKQTNGTSVSPLVNYTSYTANDVIGIGLNVSDGEITWYKNGVSIGSTSDSYVQGKTWKPIQYVNGTNHTNFGQNPTFSGNTTAGTYTDSNGKGLFKYQPPTGFLALCEDNLPTPAIADPGKHFKTVLWTGVNDTVKIKCGFQPDFVWIKNRDYVNWHALHDSIRGPYLELNSNENSADRDRSSNDGLRSFDSDGFTSGLDDNTGGRPGDSYVAWCWKAGGAAVSNTDGTITSQVSANQDAGFSIVSYTVSGTSAYTTGHGLNQAPEFIIWKSRDRISSYSVYHKDVGNGNVLRLDTDAASSVTGSWNNTTPNSSVVSHGGYYDGDNIIYYAWHSVENFSKFGSYTGTGVADGPFVYCGFKPAWVLVKRSSGSGPWYISDSSRNPTNPVTGRLNADDATIENNSFQWIEFYSNGFKLTPQYDGSWNASGSTFIFAAFAESPFQTANAK